MTLLLTIATYAAALMYFAGCLGNVGIFVAGSPESPPRWSLDAYAMLKTVGAFIEAFAIYVVWTTADDRPFQYGLAGFMFCRATYGTLLPRAELLQSVKKYDPRRLYTSVYMVIVVATLWSAA